MQQILRFDRVEVRPAERALLIDGARAELGSRAFDVLQALIQHRDRVMTKDELLDMAWPGLVVEENNLQAQVSTLRKLLGPKSISTIPGRGYQFSLGETVLAEAPVAATLAVAVPTTLTASERAAVLGGKLPVPAPPISALSIAVLPFANLTGDPNDEYFSDGLADELLHVLAKIKGLRVAARTSAFSFKGKSATITEIGRLLNVATLLEGSIRKSGNRVRISVQLVKVEDGFHLWSETYDRTLDDIFAVQDDIAQYVLAELRVKFQTQASGKIEMRGVEAEVAAAAKGRSGNVEAHRLYLQAKFFMNRHAATDVMRCVEYLRQALNIDPRFAQAWAALSHALVTAADLGAAPVAESAAEAFKAVQRALALDGDLVDGHVAMCTYQTMHAWDWCGAVNSL